MGRDMKTQALNRRQILAAGGVAAAGLALDAPGAIAAGAAPVANTKYGKIRGIANGSIKVFKGVPYGASTAGANRFMPPQPPAPWSDVRDTIAYGDQSPQAPAMGFMEEEIVSLDHSPMSEDCLRLNVWTAGLEGRQEAAGDGVVPWRRLFRRLGRQCPV